jgi:hypothetical protein
MPAISISARFLDSRLNVQKHASFGWLDAAHWNFSAAPTRMIQILIDTILHNRIFRSF